jgi:hypothetical protein
MTPSIPPHSRLGNARLRTRTLQTRFGFVLRIQDIEMCPIVRGIFIVVAFSGCIQIDDPDAARARDAARQQAAAAQSQARWNAWVAEHNRVIDERRQQTIAENDAIVRREEGLRLETFTCPISEDINALTRELNDHSCWDDSDKAERQQLATCRSLLADPCVKSRAMREEARPSFVARNANIDRKLAWLKDHCQRVNTTLYGQDQIAIDANGNLVVDTPTVAFSALQFRCPKGSPKEMVDAATHGIERNETSLEMEDRRCLPRDTAASECAAKYGDLITAPQKKSESRRH